MSVYHSQLPLTRPSDYYITVTVRCLVPIGQLHAERLSPTLTGSIRSESSVQTENHTRGLPYITSAWKGEGVSKSTPNLWTNSISFADREEGGGQNILKLCGRQIWKHPKGKSKTTFRNSSSLLRFPTPAALKSMCLSLSVRIGGGVFLKCTEAREEGECGVVLGSEGSLNGGDLQSKNSSHGVLELWIG